MKKKGRKGREKAEEEVDEGGERSYPKVVAIPEPTRVRTDLFSRWRETRSEEERKRE